MDSLKMSELAELGERERNNIPILFAEDSPMLQRLVSDALAQSGYINLHTYANGQEAWDIYSRLILCKRTQYKRTANAVLLYYINLISSSHKSIESSVSIYPIHNQIVNAGNQLSNLRLRFLVNLQKVCYNSYVYFVFIN